MKHPPIPIVIQGPTGDDEHWQIEFVRIKPDRGHTVYGYCDWERRAIQVNNRLRNPETIRDTVTHEINHATVGENGSERLATKIEANNRTAQRALTKSLGIP